MKLTALAVFALAFLVGVCEGIHTVQKRGFNLENETAQNIGDEIRKNLGSFGRDKRSPETYSPPDLVREKRQLGGGRVGEEIRENVREGAHEAVDRAFGGGPMERREGFEGQGMGRREGLGFGGGPMEGQREDLGFGGGPMGRRDSDSDENFGDRREGLGGDRIRPPFDGGMGRREGLGGGFGMRNKRQIGAGVGFGNGGDIVERERIIDRPGYGNIGGGDVIERERVIDNGDGVVNGGLGGPGLMRAKRSTQELDSILEHRPEHLETIRTPDGFDPEAMKRQLERRWRKKRGFSDIPLMFNLLTNKDAILKAGFEDLVKDEKRKKEELARQEQNQGLVESTTEESEFKRQKRSIPETAEMSTLAPQHFVDPRAKPLVRFSRVPRQTRQFRSFAANGKENKEVKPLRPKRWSHVPQNPVQPIISSHGNSQTNSRVSLPRQKRSVIQIFSSYSPKVQPSNSGLVVPQTSRQISLPRQKRDMNFGKAFGPTVEPSREFPQTNRKSSLTRQKRQLLGELDGTSYGNVGYGTGSVGYGTGNVVRERTIERSDSTGGIVRERTIERSDPGYGTYGLGQI